MIFNKGSFVVLPILIKSTYYVYVYCTIMYRYPSFGRFFIMSPGSSIQLTLLNKQKCLFIYKWTNIVLIINVLYLPASTEFSNQYNNHILYACHCQRLFHIKKILLIIYHKQLDNFFSLRNKYSILFIPFILQYFFHWNKYNVINLPVRTNVIWQNSPSHINKFIYRNT